MKWKFHKTGKSLLVFLLSAVIILSMIPAVAVHAETVTVQYDVSEFKGDKDSSEWTYPSQEGKVFAGWFTDETYETAYTGTTGMAHARFVDETIMQVKLQCNSTADAKDETIHIRFLTAIKDTMLKSVTFHVAVTELGKSWDWVEKTAYKSVLEDGATAASDASTSFGSTDATYFVVHTLKNIPKSVYSKSFTATVSWKTLDGTTVTGITREFKPDGLDELLLTLPDTATRAFGSGITKTTDDSGVTLTVNNGSESGGLFEIGEPRYNASSWEVGAVIGATEDDVIRKGVGVVTPQGSLLLYVSNEVAGYVTWDTLVDKDDNSIRSAALPISDKVKGIIAQGKYTLKAIATDIDGAGTGKINLYVNDIWVYTFVNNHVAKSNGTVSETPLDLSAKILPSIGAYCDQNVGVSFSDWYYRIEAEQVKEVGTVSGTFAKLDGTALPDTVTITFGSESFGNISRTVTIGDSKDFEILLPVGDYTVDVAADGYQGGCAPITVKTGANDIGIVRLLQEMTEVVLWFDSGTNEQSGNSVTLGVPAGNRNHGVEWQIGKDITGATSWTVSAHIAPGALDQHGFTVGTADGGSGALFLFVNADKAGHYSWQTFVQKETGSEFWKYWSLSDEAKAAMASEDGYTLTLEATGMDGKLSGVLSLYVNDIKVYSVANTFVGINSDHGCEDVWMDLQNCHLSLAVRSDPGDTTGGATYASATFSDWYYTYSTEPSDTEDTEDTDNTEGWTIMPLRDSIKEWINVNGSLTSTESGAVLSTTEGGGAHNQLLCQFADAGENITAFQISTKVQPDAMARRGVGFRTPYGYMFFNVIEDSGNTGVGYVAFNTDGSIKEQNYQELDVVAGQFITGTTKAYTLKLVAKDLTGTENDKIYFYVNNILVYTYTNTLGWDLTEQVRPAIGVRNTSASATFTDYTFKVLCDEDNTKEAPDTANWTTVSLLDFITEFINTNGTLTIPSVSGGAAGFATAEGNAANQLLCQFANAAENISAFEISTKVQPGAMARRGVGFKTPDGYIFFNVVENSNTNGAGYVWYNISYQQQSQDYVVLKEAAEEVVTGADPYTLKLVATDLTGTSADTITLYVNDIAVYTYTNTLGWNLTEKVLPAIGVRGDSASATFTNYTCKVEYCEHTGGTATCKTQATCEICGEPYGELDPENHEGGTGIRNAKEQIGSADGYTGDTYCLGCDVKIQDGETIPTSGTWTNVHNRDKVTGDGFINNNCGVNRDQESSGIVTMTAKDSNVDNQILLQFANAAENIKAFEISTTVTAGTGRRGVGFKTPDGYLFFNVVENGGDNGAGYVEFYVSDVVTINGTKKSQAYQALDADAEAIIVGDEAYTLRLVVTDINDAGTGTFEFYVNDILVYTMDNTFTNAEGNPWNLSTKVLAAIGVRGSNASATFTNYTFKVQYE